MKHEDELKERLNAEVKKFADRLAKLVLEYVEHIVADVIKQFPAGATRRQLAMFQRRCRQEGCIEPSAGPAYGHYCREHGKQYRQDRLAAKAGQ